MAHPPGFDPVLPVDDFDEDAQTRITLRPQRSVRDEDATRVAPREPSVPATKRNKRPAFLRYRELSPRWQHPLGEVYAATDQQTREQVLLTVLNPIKTLYQDHLEAAWRTATTLSKIEHPGVAPIVDVVHERQQVALVAPAIEGTPLFQHLHRRPMAPSRVVALLRQLCQILAACHRDDVVHGAISIASVWLGTRDGREDAVILTDFGLREVLEGEVEVTPSWAALQPVAPERVLGLARTEREDIYHLGALGYLMLTGGAPFRTGDAAAVARRHAIEEPMPIAERLRGRGLPPRALIEVVERCLHKDADDRFESVAHVEAALLLAQAEAGLHTAWDDLPLPEVATFDRERVVTAIHTSVPSFDDEPADGAPEPVELAPSRPLLLPEAAREREPWEDHSPFAQPSASPLGSVDTPSARPWNSGHATGDMLFGAPSAFDALEFDEREALGRRKMGPFIAGVVAVLLGVGGYAAWSMMHDGAKPEDAPPTEVRVIHAPPPDDEEVAAAGESSDEAAALVLDGTEAFNRKDYAEAVRLFEQALELDPENTEYRLLLGDAFYKNERYDEARVHYEQARAQGNPAAEHRLANVARREREG